jgi:hypothetical protein
VDALKETHRRVRGLHSGEIEPFRDRPAVN